MKIKNIYTLLCLLFYCGNSSAQDSITTIKKWRVGGYIKYVPSIQFDEDFINTNTVNLIHQRINIKWNQSSDVYFNGEFRNRIFIGEIADRSKDFENRLHNNSGAITLDKIWINERGIAFHTNTERLYTHIQKEKWNARIGRQRINWGITNYWNPNDIYNAYNFLDIDYEERAGVDAVKWQYYLSDFANIELVYAAPEKNQSVSAARYFFNKNNYDIQVIGGWYKNQLTIGTGWAGNIAEAGFKGEVQFYCKHDQLEEQLNISIGTDYLFKKGWYLNAGFLYNSRGINSKLDDWADLNLNLSAKNLMPGKYSLMLACSKEFSPIHAANFNLVYSPRISLLILMPSVSFNLHPDLDADIICQSYFCDLQSSFKGIKYLGVFRIRWSF